MTNYPFISIIIPTYNRSNLLKITLDSLLNQNYPKENFEIIISNNNSTDNTEDIIANFKQLHKNYNVIYYFEINQGVHYARNNAAKISKGDYLYFTDDDMILNENALLELINLFNIDKNIASATGLSDCNVYSCHQMIKREIFFKTGGFNPENTKGVWIGDGETGLNIKIKDLGLSFGFTRKSIIYHMIPPNRMTQYYLNKRMLNQGNCDSYTSYKKYKHNKYNLIKNNFLFILKIIINLLLMISYLVLYNSKWRLKMSNIYYYYSRCKYNFKLYNDDNFKNLVLRENWL